MTEKNDFNSISLENIKIRFYELDDNDRLIWEDYGRFTEADVHHQYAIALKTPPYRKTNIEESVSMNLNIQISVGFYMFDSSMELTLNFR